MPGKAMIELADADIFQREELVLRNVSLTIDEGEFVYIIGRVGTGKTSLIKTLIAEIPLVEGTGTVAGYSLHNIRNRDIPMLRRRLGVIFQDFRLLHDRNVKANLEFVLRATGWKQQKAINERIHNVMVIGRGTAKDCHCQGHPQRSVDNPRR
jgi:cell division transport system ATP-binding protein